MEKSCSISSSAQNPCRNSNIELYRIVVMMQIIAHHYVVNSGLIDTISKDSLSYNSLFYYFIGAWGKTGINCFVFITGYFMCKTSITLNKFLKLYLQIIFYNIVIYSVFCFTGYAQWSFSTIIYSLFPFRNIVSDCFTHAFIVWWLFIPFLNVLVNNMTKSQHVYLTLFCVAIFVFYPLMPRFDIACNPICWFSTLYLIASYIRIYPCYIFEKRSLWGLISVLLIVLSFCSIYLILYVNYNYNKSLPPYLFLCDYNTPFALLVALSSFLYFKNMRMNYVKPINVIGASTFGVLLIHANGAVMRQWLWIDLVDCVGHYGAFNGWLYCLTVVVVIFIFCSIIDIIRQRTIELWLFKQLSSWGIK